MAEENKPAPPQRINANVEKILRLVAEQQEVSKQGQPIILARGDLKAENGNSILSRYDLKGDTKDMTVVVKQAVYSTDVADKKYGMIRERFDNEITFYSRILPGLRKSGEDLPRIPEYYYHETNEKGQFLVIEDLTGEKFLNLDAKLGLDRQHIKVAVEALAKFHTALLEWKKMDPPEFYSTVRQLKNVSITESSSSTQKEKLTKALTTSVEAVSYLSSVYLTRPSHENVDKCLGAFLNDELVLDAAAFEPWALICHGSCWTKNFLFKHDKNDEIEDFALIDFQSITLSSALLDVNTCLLASTDVTCLNDLRPFYAKYRTGLKYKMGTAFHAHLLGTGRLSVLNAIYFLYFFAFYTGEGIDKATESLVGMKYNFLSDETLKNFSKRLVSVVKEAVALKMI